MQPSRQLSRQNRTIIRNLPNNGKDDIMAATTSTIETTSSIPTAKSPTPPDYISDGSVRDTTKLTSRPTAPPVPDDITHIDCNHTRSNFNTRRISTTTTARDPASHRWSTITNITISAAMATADQLHPANLTYQNDRNRPYRPKAVSPTTYNLNNSSYTNQSQERPVTSTDRTLVTTTTTATSAATRL